MLMEIFCEKFLEHGKHRGAITFHPGLNIILGSETGSNSIGKSTFLMIVDFIFGGSDYIDKLTDVQSKVGEQRICFAFKFQSGIYYFSRSSVNYKEVCVCDRDYNIKDSVPWSIDMYTSFLQKEYELNLPGLTFRNAIGRFSRIKDAFIDERHPIQQVQREKESSGIKALLKLVELYSDIEKKDSLAKEAKNKYDAFISAQKYKYIPSASNQSECKKNSLIIEELTKQLYELENQYSESICGMAEIKAKIISDTKKELSKLRRQYSRLSSEIDSMRDDQSLNSSKFRGNFDGLIHFFPNVNLKRIEDIEQFHENVTNILKDEFQKTEEQLLNAQKLLKFEIDYRENFLKILGVKTNVPRVIFEKYSTIKNKITKLQEANDSYDKKKKLNDEKKITKQELDKVVLDSVLEMQEKINSKMKELNDAIYDGKKSSPILTIKDSDHYDFSTPNDLGTGSKYKGIIVFDLAMLELTKLPVIIHDSIMLKHIEDNAIEKILELYTRTNKQVFIALDKKGSYSQKAQNIMQTSTVLQLGSDSAALFGKTWNSADSKQQR